MACLVLSALSGPPCFGADAPVALKIDWDKTVTVSKTTATMMHMVHPISRKGAPIHNKAIAAVKDLDAKYVRYLNWHVYPRLALAALHAPTKDKTSWDFSLIDAELVPFLEATQGREPVVSFAGIPPWMFKNDQPVIYPEDPNEVVLHPLHGKELLDPSGEQVAQYFARIVSWYTQGGFTDENGTHHRSGHHYELPWWEVLNEADAYSPEQYTRLSDAIIAAVRKVSPKTRFIGLSLYAGSPEFFEYWLNTKNHRRGIALDMMAYHFYALPVANLFKYDPGTRQTINEWQYSFFDQASAFVEKVKYVEAIRKRLSPATRVNFSEMGTVLPGEGDPDIKDLPIPAGYVSLSAGVFAYLYSELSKQGIDILTQSLVAGGPGMAPGQTMIDWKTGKPNARFHVLKLLNDHFAPGDRLVETKVDDGNTLQNVAAQAFVTPKGRRLLLINKRAYPVEISVALADRLIMANVVDEKNTAPAARSERIDGQKLRLEPFAVAVVDIE